MLLKAFKPSQQRAPAAWAGPASSAARAPTGARAAVAAQVQPQRNPSSAIAGSSPARRCINTVYAQASASTAGGNGQQGIPVPLSPDGQQPSGSLREFPSRSCLLRTPSGALRMRLSVKRRPIYCGQAAAGDFPDSPHDNWAVAVAYRELIQRVRRILNKDPNAVIPEARVDHAGNRVVPWQPGDETLRPEVIRRLRAALTLGRAAPGGASGGPRTTNPDLPRGSGLTRRTVEATSASADPNAQPRPGSLYMSLSVDGKMVQAGRAAMGDFPDCPEDGWTVALQYKDFIRGVIAQLKADPEAEVEVANVNVLAGGRRLKGWQPGDQSVRPVVLRAIRDALGQC